jgi:hypothetical protein
MYLLLRKINIRIDYLLDNANDYDLRLFGNVVAICEDVASCSVVLTTRGITAGGFGDR